MMLGPTLRPARTGDYESLYGVPLPFTIRAEVAEIGGRAVGIGGIAYIHGQPVLFSRMTDELRPFKKFIVRCARRAAQMASDTHAAAIASPKEQLSCKLLMRLGLSWQGTSTEGEVFRWRVT